MLIGLGGTAQVHIQQGSGVHLQENAGLYLQGDLNTSDNITGGGSVFMIGDSIQSINANGFSIPAISINNNNGVSLTGDLTIADRCSLMDGNLILNRFILSLSEDATIENANDRAIVTNSSGVIRKRANKDLHEYLVPLSNTKNYTPLILSMHGKYHNGYIEVGSFAKPSPHKPANAGEYLDNHWKLVSKGIEGDINAIAITGNGTGYATSPNLSGYLWQDGKWKTSPFDAGKIRATIKSGETEIYAMSINSNLLQPNPAVHNTVLVYNSENAGRSQLVVTDSRGRIVQARTVNIEKGINRYNLNLDNLVKGYYDVSVIQHGKKTTLKLVKQ